MMTAHGGQHIVKRGQGRDRTLATEVDVVSTASRHAQPRRPFALHDFEQSGRISGVGLTE